MAESQQNWTKQSTWSSRKLRATSPTFFLHLVCIILVKISRTVVTLNWVTTMVETSEADLAAFMAAISGYIVLSGGDMLHHIPLIVITTVLMGFIYGDRVHEGTRLENPDGVSVAGSIPPAFDLFLSNFSVIANTLESLQF
jgi:hypothetical protein